MAPPLGSCNYSTLSELRGGNSQSYLEFAGALRALNTGGGADTIELTSAHYEQPKPIAQPSFTFDPET